MKKRKKMKRMEGHDHGILAPVDLTAPKVAAGKNVGNKFGLKDAPLQFLMAAVVRKKDGEHARFGPNHLSCRS